MPGDGPVPCDVAIVSDYPRATDVRLKRPLSDISGDIFWQLARKYAGLDRALCYVDNFCQRRIDDAKAKLDAKEFGFWRDSLQSRLEAVSPKVVVTVGAMAARATLGDDFNLHVGHGIVHSGDRWRVVPCYHPAGVFVKSKGEDALALVGYDLTQVGKCWRGELSADVDPHGPATQEYTFQPFDFGPEDALAIDTEYIDGVPICLTATTKPGRAFIIWAHEKERLALLADCIKTVRPTVIFHHAMADIHPLKQLGIDIIGWDIPWRDTREMAYLLRTEPQALKDLARRHLALEVEDWSELVSRHYNPLVLARGADWVADNTTLSPVVTHSPETGRPYKKPRGGKITRDKHTRSIARYLKARDVGNLRKLLDWPEPSLAFVPEDEIRTYALKDPDATLRYYLQLVGERVQTESSEGVGRTICGSRNPARGFDLEEIESLDNAALPMFARMSEVGLLFDKEAHGRLSDFITTELDRNLELCKSLAGADDFNPTSTDGVAVWCRDEHRRSGTCKLYRKTSSGDQEAADKAALSQILGQHPLIQAILDYRGLAKLKSGYVDKLPGTIKEGRYHPDWRLHGVHSGRAAEWVLTFPSRSELGRKIRSCFVAPEGYELASFDLSQIEYRITAALSQDPEMLRAYRSGSDLHHATNLRLFGGRKEMRVAAKTVNFLMLYGGGAKALWAKLIENRVVDDAGKPKYTVDTCAEWIGAWFNTYTGVKELIEHTTDFIRTTGYSRTELGRRRPLPAIYLHGDRLDYLREEAIRQGFNHVIQGTAQEVIKRAMVRIWRSALPDLRAKGISVEPLLQYHDELVFQIPEGTWETCQAAIVPCMTADSERYNLPILAEGSHARTWGDLK